MHPWALGLMTQAMASGLVALRDWVGDGLSMVLGATLQSAMLAWLGESLYEFCASRPCRLRLWTPVLATCFSGSLLLHLLPVRIWVNAALFAVQIALLLGMPDGHARRTDRPGQPAQHAGSPGAASGHGFPQRAGADRTDA